MQGVCLRLEDGQRGGADEGKQALQLVAARGKEGREPVRLGRDQVRNLDGLRHRTTEREAT